jgi:CheY-like chemotaxis protein
MTLARRARLAAGLAPEDFAKLVGTDPTTYLGWETGSRKPGATAVALLRLLEADPEFVLSTLRGMRPPRRTGTVLLVVDDEESRGALWNVSEEEGFDVAAASNGWEAIEYLKRNDVPCAIILDLVVPLVNGWQLLSWLRRQPEPLAACPVMTVSADPTHAEAAVKDGVVKHFPKPIDLTEVLGVIKQHCKTAA